MTTGEYSPLLRNGSNRSTTQHHLPINANYFDITDVEGWPIAGLLVMLDGQAQPVRAELHLYDALDPHTQEAAIRQARMVLQERYLGGAPVPVRILETLQVREEMIVRLPPVGARSQSVSTFSLHWRPHGMVAGAILGLVLLIWIVSVSIGSRRSADQNLTPETPASVGQNGGPAAATETESANDASGNTAPGLTDVPMRTNGADLPISRNARGDLGIGMQVRVVPGLRLALRSEPGADRGIVVGEMAEGIVATIVGGPEFSQGDSDTIVWWFVDLPNGAQAWAAANTSQQTLLMPAQ